MGKRKVIVVKREKKNFICKQCGKEVNVLRAKPWIIKTDKYLYKTWDYGHRHERHWLADSSGVRRVK